MEKREIEATRAAQGLMRAFSPGLIVDGHWGSYTQSVFDAVPASVREAVKAALSTYATSPQLLRDAFLRDKSNGGADKQRALQERKDSGILDKIASYFSDDKLKSSSGTLRVPSRIDGRDVFLDPSKYSQDEVKRAERGVSSPAGTIVFMRMVPLLIKRGRELGFKHPEVLAAQFALESSWGQHVGSNFNYGGFKAAPGEKSTKAPSPEGFGATKTVQTSSWVSYDSVEDFVERALAKLKRTWPDTYTAETLQDFLKAWRMYQGGDRKYSTSDPNRYVGDVKSIVTKYFA